MSSAGDNIGTSNMAKIGQGRAYTIYAYPQPDSSILWKYSGSEPGLASGVTLWRTTSNALNPYGYHFSIQNYYAGRPNPTYIDNYKEYMSYATDGPYLTYVADAGASYTFHNFDPAALAATGSWDTASVRFQHSFDDGVEAYNNVWLTLSQLRGVSKVYADRRYLRIKIQNNSDGVTQHLISEINADTAFDGMTPVGGEVITYPVEYYFNTFHPITQELVDADSTPTGTFYANGVLTSGTSVVVDRYDTGFYRASAALDAAGLIAGDRVFMRVLATVGGTQQAVCSPVETLINAGTSAAAIDQLLSTRHGSGAWVSGAAYGVSVRM